MGGRNVQLEIDWALKEIGVHTLAKHVGVSKGQIERWRDGRDKVAEHYIDSVVTLIHQAVFKERERSKGTGEGE